MKSNRLLAAAAAASLATPVAAQNLPAQFRARVLAGHNAERATLGLPPLSWDNDLANGAAAYAQQMARTDIFRHSDRRGRPGVAENLWMGTRGVYSVERMVGAWLAEKRHFVPGIFPNNSRTGNWFDISHYSQLIWPTTQRVGCAVASSRRADYLVCRYFPKGNIDGRPVGFSRTERG